MLFGAINIPFGTMKVQFQTRIWPDDNSSTKDTEQKFDILLQKIEIGWRNI